MLSLFGFMGKSKRKVCSVIGPVMKSSGSTLTKDMSECSDVLMITMVVFLLIKVLIQYSLLFQKHMMNCGHEVYGRVNCS